MTTLLTRIVRFARALAQEVAALLRWWIAELHGLAAWFKSAVRLQGSRQFVLRLTGEDASTGTDVVLHAADDSAVELLRAPLATLGDVATAGALATAGLPKRAKVRLLLPSSAVLLCPLRLPALRDADRSAAIELQLERKLPLARQQVYVDWRVASGDASSADTVTVAAARRSTIDALSAAVRAWAWEISAVEVAGGGEWRLLPQRAALVDFTIGRRERRLIALAAVLLVACIATVGGQWLYERSMLSDELALARTRAKQIATQRTLLEQQARSIKALRDVMAAPDGRQVLAAVTRAVPVDSWLYRAEIRIGPAQPASVELRGYGPSATTLVDVLEQQPDFEAVELVAANTAGDGALNRIELRARWQASPREESL